MDYGRQAVSHNINNPIIDYGGARLLLLWASPVLDCKTVGFFSKMSKKIGKAWRKSLTRAKRPILTCP